MEIVARRFNRLFLILGAALLAFGIWIWSWASPSPHGYIELVFALPLACMGLLFVGSALFGGRRSYSDPVAWIGALVILAALTPLIGLISLFALS